MLFPLSTNGCAAEPPIALRSPVMVMPVLVGFAPGVTVNDSKLVPPAMTESGFAAPVPEGFVGVGVGVAVGVGVGVAVGVGVGVMVGVGVGVEMLHAFAGEELFLGLGALAVKSAELLSVSVHPLPALNAAVVFDRVGADPEPSKKLAPLVPVPNPTKSFVPAGFDPDKADVEVTRATFPAVALIVIVPVASGVGRFVVPPVPAASWTR